ncbi:carboxylating nicotinate-nucleotide diphosphorylase [bacterium]|nr:carboxylating nicotinate-nucleotide diphosphorylase [bacterium]
MCDISDGVKDLIKGALEEDIGSGDVTCEALIDPNSISRARVISKNDGILAGTPYLMEVFRQVDPKIRITALKKEGNRLQKGEPVFEIEGNTRAILKGERTALNLLCHLSGIATLTQKFVQKIHEAGNFKTRILDTRKTTPLWRDAEKYAVRVGGGDNHRMGLYDMILIKENHLTGCGGIVKALDKLSGENIGNLEVEVEVKNLEELRIALGYNVHRIMLDNFTPKMINDAMTVREKAGSGIPFEVSGGVTIENISEYIDTGAEYISIGSLTHSSKASDFSLIISAD